MAHSQTSRSTAFLPSSYGWADRLGDVLALLAYRLQPPLSDVFQLVEAAVLERDLRACDQVFDGARDENLAGLCLRGNARSDGNRDSARLLPHQLALPRVKAGPNLEPERAHILHQRTRTLDRPARTVERGEEAVARSVDLLAVELPQPAPNESVMLLEQRTPRRVPELRGTLCRADDVGEEHGCENSVWLLWSADAAQEPLAL